MLGSLGQVLRQRLGLILVALSLVMAVTTARYLQQDETVIVSDTVLLILLADIVMGLSTIAVVAVRLVTRWGGKRGNQVATRLQTRLVVTFSMIAVAPAVLVAIISALVFNFGVEAWFSDRVQKVVLNSVRVANLYLEEHARVIRGDLLAMAKDTDSVAGLYDTNRREFDRLFRRQAAMRSLTEAYIMTSSGNILARSRLMDDIIFEPFPLERLEQASAGVPIIFASAATNDVRAVVKLRGFIDGFLFVSRPIAPETVDHLRATQIAANEYDQFEQKITGFQVTFAVAYILMATMIMLGSIFVGMWLARRLSRPLGDLIEAADQVSAGQLDVKLDQTGRDHDEIDHLISSFNRMTQQLQQQRQQLVYANEDLADRTSFIETVLSGVSAGVIGLTVDGHITAINSTAKSLLGLSGNILGQNLGDLVPEFHDMDFRAEDHALTQTRPKRISIRREQQPVELMVRVNFDQHDNGLVVTLDDVTALLQAQRLAAWSDVARRVAHEIRNPLTPIQLATERMKRKFRPESLADQQVFDKCTDTIVRQVEDIKRMVDEFSTFARMPKPSMRQEDICEILKQAVFLQQVANPDIQFELSLGDKPIWLNLDSRLISQAVINVIKNAIESLRGGDEDEKRIEKVEEPQIAVFIDQTNDQVTVTIRDNGPGFPPELISRLKEPYVTTRKKGTGLGLAIVDRIMKDHMGELHLFNAGNHTGACVSLSFHTSTLAPRNSKESS